MFIEWWERFRGIDQWPETRAEIRCIDSWGAPNIENADPAVVPSPVNRTTTMLKRMAIEYKSADGMLHSRKLWVLLCPMLFALDAGDYFYLRYSPDDPKKVYLRERTQSAVQGLLISSVIVLVIVWASHFSS